MQDIGINQQWLLNALEIFKELSIKIQFINTFYQVDKKLALCDFSYSGNSIDECYIELLGFLDGLNDKNELFYSIDFITDNPESIELNIFLDKLALQIK